MKIAISGKGGVGKTTLAAAMAWLFAHEDNKKVFAIDADPAPNLALALGIEKHEDIVPMIDMKELIKERTGATSEEYGKFFKLNPTVADLPERLWLEKDGVRLMVLGAIQRGGGGCACPESVFLRSMINHIVLQRDEVAVADMEAGVEHLGRASVRGVNALIIVVEPTLPSVEIAHRIKRLAADIGLKSVFAVGNKIQDNEQQDFIEKRLGDIPVLGFLSFNPNIPVAGLKGTPVLEDKQLMKEAEGIVKRLKTELGITA
ncbi:MAG: AAA family ATPase [Candidatus Brocadiales bacterium]